MIESMLSFLFFECLVALLCLLGSGVSIMLWFQLEIFSLARAHLYKNNTSRCAVSSLWPQQIFPVELHCSKDGQVEGTFTWSWVKQVSFKEHVNLKEK